jgi:hypothetical protein
MKLPGPLAKLDEEQHQFLIGMLSLGKPDGEITDAIIEKGWLPDVKRDTLLRNVNRWRKSKGKEAVLKQVTDHLTTSTGKMKRQIDVLEELTQLVLKQKTRVKKMADLESDKPLLMQTMTDEMKTLLQMLEKLGKFQLDTGLLRRVKAGEVEGDYVDVEEVPGEGEEVWTEEDRRLLAIVQQEVLGIGGPTR